MVRVRVRVLLMHVRCVAAQGRGPGLAIEGNGALGAGRWGDVGEHGGGIGGAWGGRPRRGVAKLRFRG